MSAPKGNSKRKRPAQYAAQFTRTARNKLNRIRRIARRKLAYPQVKANPLAVIGPAAAQG